MPTFDSQSDETVLTDLNEGYVQAFMDADAGWYDAHLADDFVCIESDGSVLDKARFLEQAAAGPDVAAYRLAEVRIRQLGDVALIHATGVFTRRDGSTGTSRYTDVYAKRDGAWQAVSAQITRAEGEPAGGFAVMASGVGVGTGTGE
jgi:ketosteroid isomerase-like protein